MNRIKLVLKYYIKSRWIKRYQQSIGKIVPSFPTLYTSNAVANDDCTEIEVNTNQISSFIFTDILPLVGVTPFPITELLLMSSAIVKLKPTHIFEWGTHLGISARIFYEVCKNYNINTIINSVDLPDDVEHIEHPGIQRGIKVKGLKNVILHQGDGLNISIEIANKLKGENKLLFFLDGDHSFESVSRELNGIHNAFPKSYKLIHDTFYQSSKSGYNIGPHEAIKEFLEQNPNQYKKISTDLGLPGMTLLYPSTV